MKVGATLTGRIRYRPNFWGTKFILQVEEVVTRAYATFALPISNTDGEWRDAKIHDFDLLSIKTPAACPEQQASTKTEN